MRWNNIIEIVEALEENYPDEELLSLGASEVLDLVVDMPEFEDGPDDADDALLKNILLRWKELRDEH